MQVSTVFEVRKPSKDVRGAVNEQFKVAAIGQSACEAIRKQFPKRKLMLIGFQVNKKFILAF